MRCRRPTPAKTPMRETVISCHPSPRLFRPRDVVLHREAHTIRPSTIRRSRSSDFIGNASGIECADLMPIRDSDSGNLGGLRNQRYRSNSLGQAFRLRHGWASSSPAWHGQVAGVDFGLVPDLRMACFPTRVRFDPVVRGNPAERSRWAGANPPRRTDRNGGGDVARRR